MKAETKLTIATTITIINTMVGVAILSLPFAYYRLGLVLGLFFTFLAAFFAVLAYKNLVKCVHHY